MGDQHNRLASLVVDALQFQVHALARHGIERAEGLVHEDDLRIVHQRPADGGALLHAAGELPGILGLEILEPRHGQELAGPGEMGLPVELAHLDRHHHVAQHRTPRQEHRILEDDAHIIRRLLYGDAADLHLAFGRRYEAGHEFQECGLAAPGRPDDGDEFTVGNIEIDRPQRGNVSAPGAIGFSQIADLDQLARRGRLALGLALGDDTKRCHGVRLPAHWEGVFGRKSRV